jgi:hypothetical protein
MQRAVPHAAGFLIGGFGHFDSVRDSLCLTGGGPGGLVLGNLLLQGHFLLFQFPQLHRKWAVRIGKKFVEPSALFFGFLLL